MPLSENPKSVLRRTIRERLKEIAGDRNEASRRACALLEQQPVWQSARAILFYAPVAGELNIWPLVEDSLTAGKNVCLPRYDATTGQYVGCRVENLTESILTGQFGIREPAPGCSPFPLNQLDLVLVPGVAFDLRGHRLGRGKGFYDRLLAAAGGLKCGVAFDEQIVTEIPVEPHDVSLDCILTPTRWVQP